MAFVVGSLLEPLRWLPRTLLCKYSLIRLLGSLKLSFGSSHPRTLLSKCPLLRLLGSSKMSFGSSLPRTLLSNCPLLRFLGSSKMYLGSSHGYRLMSPSDGRGIHPVAYHPVRHLASEEFLTPVHWRQKFLSIELMPSDGVCSGISIRAPQMAYVPPHTCVSPHTYVPPHT